MGDRTTQRLAEALKSVEIGSYDRLLKWGLDILRVSDTKRQGVELISLHQWLGIGESVQQDIPQQIVKKTCIDHNKLVVYATQISETHLQTPNSALLQRRNE